MSGILYITDFYSKVNISETFDLTSESLFNAVKESTGDTLRDFRADVITYITTNTSFASPPFSYFDRFSLQEETLDKWEHYVVSIIPFVYCRSFAKLIVCSCA